MIYKAAMTHPVVIRDYANVFDGKANITVEQSEYAIVFSDYSWTSINTNVSLTNNGGYGSAFLIKSFADLQLVSNNVSKNFSIKFTTNEEYADALGIFSQNSITLGNSEKDIFRANISATASALYEAFAYAVQAEGEVRFANLAGTISSNATAKQGFAVATGIGGFGIYGTSVGKNINITAKGYSGAYADGITSYQTEDVFGNKYGFDISIGEIAAAMNINATATGDVAANAINSSQNLYLGDIKGAITCKGTGTSADVEAIRAEGDIEIGDIAKAITVTATAKADGEAEAAVVAAEGRIWIDSVEAALKVTASNGEEAEARVFESEFDIEGPYDEYYNFNGIMITEIKQALSATATTAKGMSATASVLSAEESDVYIDYIGAALSATANAKDTAEATAIKGNSIYVSQIDKNISVTATADTATACGIAGIDYASIYQVNGNISATSKCKFNGLAAALYSGNEDGSSMLYLGNVKGTLSATAANGTAAGVYSIGEINLAGDINKISANGYNAYGIYTEGMLHTDDLYVEKGIVVTGKEIAYGIKADAISYSVNSYNEGAIEIYADISVTATGECADATGIEFDYADCDTLVFSGTITGKSKDAAYGIYCDGRSGYYNEQYEFVHDAFAVSNLCLDGAKIEVKTTSKDNTPIALSIGVRFDVDTTVEIINKSTVVGDILLGNGTDKVIIESGSKVTGAFYGVEEVELVLNDVNTKNNALWQNIDGSDNVDLNIDFERGMTGEFALCTRKNTDDSWMIDANGDGIRIQLGFSDDDYIELDNYIGATAEDGLYKYELVENKKGNTLSLAVSLLD